MAANTIIVTAKGTKNPTIIAAKTRPAKTTAAQTKKSRNSKITFSEFIVPPFLPKYSNNNLLLFQCPLTP